MIDCFTAAAHGRVNIIGEHTDYHQGFVLPTLIPQRTTVTVTLRDDRMVRVSSDRAGRGWQEYELGREALGRGWLDYVQGVTWSLAQHVPLAGFEARFESTVPLGAGLSSSAALEVSLLRALRLALRFELDDVTIAKVAQRAETDFIGAPIGIMDQMVSSVGTIGEALFIDTRTLDTARVPLPADMRLLVIDSGIAHAHASGAYRTRRAESFDGAGRLGVQWLRDVPAAAVDQLTIGLPPTAAKRVRHVVTENARVVAALAALRTGDAAGLGALCNASHVSMRDDYEISTPEIDTLVAIAQRRDDVHGARMTGGGFGGAVVVLGTRDATPRTGTAICNAFQSATGRTPTLLVAP